MESRITQQQFNNIMPAMTLLSSMSLQESIT
jgi:hypothetical protein